MRAEVKSLKRIRRFGAFQQSMPPFPVAAAYVSVAREHDPPVSRGRAMSVTRRVLNPSTLEGCAPAQPLPGNRPPRWRGFQVNDVGYLRDCSTVARERNPP